MGQTVILKDKTQIEKFLRSDPFLHLYSLGDLDDFYWPFTRWYGKITGGKLTDLVLIYQEENPPVVLALSQNPDSMSKILRELYSLLPRTIYAHLSPGVESVFQASWQVVPHGKHIKMGLVNRDRLEKFDTKDVQRLTPDQVEQIQEFYQQAYPGNWFNPRMLETRQYFGIKSAGKLISIAGIHVYSPRYGVAALGNIATHPSYRGQGFAARVTARCCQSLLENAAAIGLNVRADNQAAIACYQKLGFRKKAEYGEFTIEKKG
ncbi:MAG: GNAT family N-acetyltransferase [Anaerolineales bacterium]|nr:GNAT family N-acetyltransferase [Anaerolineales bacterium]